MASTAQSPRPLVLPAQQAADILESEDVLVIDLSKPEVYAQAHIADALPMAYSLLVLGQPPAPGRMPPIASLSEQLGAHGIEQQRPIIAYDDEGGGKAARLCWTLHYLGHQHVNVIDGGLHGWMHAQLPVTQRPVTASATRFVANINNDVLADSEFILNSLNDPDVQLLDARTPGEYQGTDVRAARGGHIPGAINFNWLDTVDRDNGFCLRPASELQSMLAQAGINPDKQIVSYCQTHHRSSHSYVMLKNLGFNRVRGYAGSWSEWGNSEDWPVDTPG